jgi:predicted N-acyltransferase
MSPAPPSLSLQVHTAIGDIAAGAWDSCAGAANPFVGHAFLQALEESGSVGGATGWQPCHLALSRPGGGLAAAVPLYLKSHSMGEYVFDQSWADAAARAGRPYYPKLQGAVPFTPVTGPRLLVADNEDGGMLRPLLAGALVGLSREIGAPSVHVTFPPETEMAAMTGADFLPRLGLQYHWDNPGYRDFADFLDALAARKRKQIRKERAQVAAAGLAIETLSGADLRPADWDDVHRMLAATARRKWGRPYLTRAFFEALGAPPLGHRVVVVRARRAGRTIAVAWNMEGAEALFGRSWGAEDEVPFLHFELCYYRALDHAIARRLARVEAGAQGEHKIARGYLPRLTHSAHWIADPTLRRAIASFLDHERAQVAAAAEALADESPFRSNLPDGRTG